MKATKIHEFSNGTVIAKLGNKNVILHSISDEQYAVWNTPPWDSPTAINKSEVNWND